MGSKKVDLQLTILQKTLEKMVKNTNGKEWPVTFSILYLKLVKMSTFEEIM